MGRKRRGHFCRICGSVLPNEKFTGRGHKNRICAVCESRERHPEKWWADDPDFSPLVRLALMMEDPGSWPSAIPPEIPLEPPPGVQPRPSREQLAEDILLMLLYLSAVRYEELDRARCCKSTLNRLLERLQEAGLITIHKKCFMFTDEGQEVACNLLTEFGLDRFDI